MKRLLIAALLAALGAPAFAVLIDTRPADRGQPPLDNVPVCTFELFASSNVTAKPAVIYEIVSNDINQQTLLPQYSAQTAMVLSGDENRGSSSTPGTKRVGFVQYRYLSDRFDDGFAIALRPDPHLVKVQVFS